MRGRRRSCRGGSSSQLVPDDSFSIDEEISHLTKLSSEPSHSTGRFIQGNHKKPLSSFKLLAGREGTGRLSLADRAYVMGRHLPLKGPWFLDCMDSEAYVSRFSDDGSLFVAGFRGSHIRIYDVQKGWKVQKDIIARSLRWTITDTSLSPDQHYLAYASLTPIVHVVNVQTGGTESYANVTDVHEGLDFSHGFSDYSDDDDYSLGIFSIKFSMDGREIVAGTNNDSIYVYDLLANKVSLRLVAHTADVNVVTFADETGNIIFSGSDDSLCKVWDRRCFTREKPAGVLAGHLDGITFIDSRGDGRYFISNGKDQAIKLWDIRKMSSSVKFSIPRAYDWDYRWMVYPSEARHMKHPHDQSLATFRGHSVLRTLIRCYFSPALSTGQRYIYTGSSDKCVYIYDIVSGEIVAKLGWHGSIIRDCSWHPHHPTLVSSSWDGYVVRWEASGDDADPSSLKAKNQRRHFETYQMSFEL
ncbi:Transducin family protein / WD-40 repeat family protein [Rhynchospora pubera]|uniref:Transducin family protein / WD-40 repeat family protein n=1 Tax=Rhynchospora pubera TaxID=906938 RepID=A0AAV8DM77_9POAL|nr:Transducin family protein / WD-40 repeat family protein [Rhynchospora pubera]